MLGPTIELSLAPVRLAVVVDLSSSDDIRKAIHLNCCSWGGLHNVLIPNSASDEEINAMMIRSDPDFVLGAEQSAFTGFKTYGARLLEYPRIFSGKQFWQPQIGVNMRAVLFHIYEKELQYVYRDKRQFRPKLSKLADSSLSLFSAAAFGEYPQLPNDQGYCYEQLLVSQLGAAKQVVHKEGFLSAIREPASSVVALTAYNEKLSVSAPHTFLWFMFDATSCEDIVTYWNFRALGYDLIPLPLQFCKSWQSSELPILEHFFSEQNFVYSAALTKRQASVLANRLNLPKPIPLKEYVFREKNSRQWIRTSYAREDDRVSIALPPAPFQEALERYVLPTPFQFKYKTKCSALDIDHMGVLLPGLELGALSSFPTEFRSAIGSLTFYASVGQSLVTFSKAKAEYFVNQWLEQEGLTSTKSAAGTNLERLVQSLGGLHQVRHIAFKPLLELFELAATEPGFADSANVDAKHKRRWRNSISYSQLWRTLFDIHHSDDKTKTHIQFLCDKNVLSTGLQLACPYCNLDNWYAMNSSHDTYECIRCLQEFKFPSSDPPGCPWAFALRGVFSLADYADGAYAVACTLRFLNNYLHDTTWVPSTEIRDSSTVGNPLETDFIMWCRDPHLRLPFAIFSEVRSFQKKFKDGDFQTAARIRSSFPRAIFIFGTFREALEPAEQKKIWAFMNPHGSLPNRSVAILTGNELLCQQAYPDSWNQYSKKEGKQIHSGSLDLLCTITQALYLNDAQYGNPRIPTRKNPSPSKNISNRLSDRPQR